MDPATLYSLAAELITKHGSSLSDAGEALGQKLLDKGSDAIAATAISGLLGWLKARAGKGKQFDSATRRAIAAPEDERALSLLRAEISSAVGSALSEFEALVRVAEQADAVVVTNIRFGGVKTAVYVEGGGTAVVPHLHVDIR